MHQAETLDHDTGELVEPPAAPPPPAPPPTVDRVLVKISGIVKRPIKDGAHKYVITADNQQTYHTFSVTIATTAKIAQEAGAVVEIVFNHTKYGRMIQALRELETEPEPPL